MELRGGGGNSRGTMTLDIGCSFKLSKLSKIKVRDFIRQKGWAITVTGVSNGFARGVSQLPVICRGHWCWGGHLLERLQISSICVMIALVDVCLMSKDG